MGLLGSSWEDPRTIASLQLAAGLLGGGSFGQAAGRGLTAYQGSLQSALEQQRRDELAKAQIASFLGEAQQRQADAERYRAALADKQRIMDAIQTGLRGGAVRPIDANNASGVTGPRPEALSVVGQSTGPDWQYMIAQGVPEKTVEALANARNLGRPEVARTINTIDPKTGRPIVQSQGKYGENIASSPMWVEPKTVNLGDRQAAWNPATMETTTIGAMGQSPDSKATNALGWANNAVARNRLNWEMGGGADVPGEPTQAALIKKFGKPEAGRRWKADGTEEPIPGGSADQKQQATQLGKGTVSDVIGGLRTMYNQLEESGGVTSTSNSGMGNLGAGIASTGIGQATGRLFGTGNQSLRNSIVQSRPLLVQAIMKSTGMSARQMDSNAELKLWLSVATDPTLDVQANRRALDQLEKLFGSDSGAAPPLRFDANGNPVK